MVYGTGPEEDYYVFCEQCRGRVGGSKKIDVYIDGELHWLCGKQCEDKMRDRA